MEIEWILKLLRLIKQRQAPEILDSQARNSISEFSTQQPSELQKFQVGVSNELPTARSEASGAVAPWASVVTDARTEFENLNSETEKSPWGAKITNNNQAVRQQVQNQTVPPHAQGFAHTVNGQGFARPSAACKKRSEMGYTYHRMGYGMSNRPPSSVEAAPPGLLAL